MLNGRLNYFVEYGCRWFLRYNTTPKIVSIVCVSETLCLWMCECCYVCIYRNGFFAMRARKQIGRVCNRSRRKLANKMAHIVKHFVNYYFIANICTSLSVYSPVFFNLLIMAVFFFITILSTIDTNEKMNAYSECQRLFQTNFWTGSSIKFVNTTFKVHLYSSLIWSYYHFSLIFYTNTTSNITTFHITHISIFLFEAPFYISISHHLPYYSL